MIYLAAIVMLIGATFAMLAAIGVLRFPDLYTRLHAASNAGPLGAGLILIGAGFASGDLLIFIRCLLGLVFLVLVGPVSAHLLARAALRTGTAPSRITSINEYDNSP
ncbi:MAG: monovalent cation/H(+) antiporter subunit G [Devosia sp.]